MPKIQNMFHLRALNMDNYNLNIELKQLIFHVFVEVFYKLFGIAFILDSYVW